MTKILIFLALILTPFIINPLVLSPIIPLIEGGTRPPKEFIAIMFSFAIFLSAICHGELRSFRNYWYLVFLFYIPLTIWHSPPFISMVSRSNIAGSWQWKPFAFIVIYALLIFVVSNLKFKSYEIRKIFLIVTIVGVIMALYVLIQKLSMFPIAEHIDQFFKVRPYEVIGDAKEPSLMGTMGNSTLVSAFLVMCLPFCLYMKKWIKAIIIIAAVLLCGSQMSTGAMILSLIVYSLILYARTRPYLGTVGLIAIVIIGYLGFFHMDKIRPHIRDNGRFLLWTNTVKDIFEPPIHQDINTPGLSADQKKYLAAQNDRTYALTGQGLGSFKLLYSEKHKQVHFNHLNQKIVKYPGWGNPHNEYLHLTQAIGIIGLCLFLILLWTSLIPALFAMKHEPLIVPLFVSIISVILLSFGTFVLEIEPTRLYSAVFMGLLLNRSLIKCQKIRPEWNSLPFM